MMLDAEMDDRPQSYISNAPVGLAYEPPDSLHILACARVSIHTVLDILPDRYVTGQVTNPPNACCRNLDNIDIEAWYSTPADRDKGIPDIYKFHCNECLDCHVRFCVGGNHPNGTKDYRPFWDMR